MHTRRSLTRHALACLLVLGTLATYAGEARAGSFQIVKLFETEVVGTVSFEFTIEKQVLGVWLYIPCVDGVGSCTLEFSNVPAGTAVVLVDTSVSWFTGGNYYIKEVAPAGWFPDGITTNGAEPNLSFKKPEPHVIEVYFSVRPDSLPDDGHLTLHNVGPDVASVPEPATLGLLGLGATLVGIQTRRTRRRGTSPQ